jgi:hypothetical protein
LTVKEGTVDNLADCCALLEYLPHLKEYNATSDEILRIQQFDRLSYLYVSFSISSSTTAAFDMIKKSNP